MFGGTIEIIKNHNNNNNNSQNCINLFNKLPPIKCFLKFLSIFELMKKGESYTVKL